MHVFRMLKVCFRIKPEFGFYINNLLNNTSGVFIKQHWFYIRFSQNIHKN